MLRERHLGGTIILADAHIRYSAPISGKPSAVADLGSLGRSRPRRAAAKPVYRCRLNSLAMKPGAVFEGTYIVLPAKPFGAYEEGGNEEE